MKRIISAILGFVLAVSCIPFSASAKTIEETEIPDNNLPVIVVAGMDFGGLVKDKGTDTEEPVIGEISAKDIIKVVFKTLGTTLIHFNLDYGVQVIVDYVGGIFKYIGCDRNGDSVYNISSAEEYDKSCAHYDNLAGIKDGGGETGIAREFSSVYGADRVYFFRYDWRIDPKINAAKINDMVELAKSENNCEKVNYICCSMGGVQTLNYLAEYGHSSIKNLVFDSSTYCGTYVATDCLNGRIFFDPVSVYNFSTVNVDNNFFRGFMKVVYKTKLLDLGCRIVNKLVERYEGTVFDEMFVDSFGTLPGFWALVQPDEYETAKQFIFRGKDADYAGLLEITDRLQRNNAAREQILADAVGDGVNISFIASYGKGCVPVYLHSGTQGDATLETHYMSGGATVDDHAGVLSDEYLASVTDKKYISGDKMIDASTCLYPDYAWFMKMGDHVGGRYGSDFNVFLRWLLMSDTQRTVGDDERFPQFIQTDGNEDFLGAVK